MCRRRAPSDERGRFVYRVGEPIPECVAPRVPSVVEGALPTLG
ncbi:hypothetical protein [Porphyromonas gingivicanis]|nr:hypothetical protein [Porphyromonas gingivicanis]